MATRTQRYVAAWTVAAAGALVMVPLLTDSLTLAPGPLLLLALAVAVAERVELSFTFERAAAVFTLVEAAITAGLLLVTPSEVVVATTLGMALAQLTRRLDLPKTAFNISQAVVGTAVAALIVDVWPDFGPQVGGRPVLGALVGMVAYLALNAAAMAGLVLRLAGRRARDSIAGQMPLTAATTLGTTAVGVVLAGLIEAQPALAPFLLAPAGAIHLAARGSLRAGELLEYMRADRDRLTRVIDGASDGIILLDRDGSVQVWNTAMERLTGLPTDRVVGRPVERVLTTAVREAADGVRGRWLIDTAHRGSQHRELDAVLRHVDGTPRVVRESHALVFDERGRCTGDVVVVRDVSRQRELERLRGDFVARVSHELRTPLTPIRGFASVLLRRGEELAPEDRHDALQRIVDRADHLSAVVEDLLLVTRLDQHDLDDLVHPVPTALDQLMSDLLADVRGRAPARTITLHVAPGTREALADPERTRQILDALLDNACRYSPEDTPIEVEIDQPGDDIRVRVIDRGPGIPRDHRETIFEQFHRLEDPLTMRTGGVGLGLFIGRRLAQAMHGSLELDEPGAGPGSVFVLHLPAAEPVDTARRIDAAG